MKITKSQLKQIIREELELAEQEQLQLNENPAAIASVVKYLPQIMQVVQHLPQILELIKSFKGAGSASPSAGSPATTTPSVAPATE